MAGESVVGTLVTHDNECILINPQPEILRSMFTDGRRDQMLAANAVVITDGDMIYARGLCTFVAYLRGLGRTRALPVVVRNDSGISMSFIASCCKPLPYQSTFDVTIDAIGVAQPFRFGSTTIVFDDGTAHAGVVVSASKADTHRRERSAA